MPNQSPEPHGPLVFFKAHQSAFDESLKLRKSQPDLIDALLNRAYSSFEVNARLQAEGQPSLACHKGCSTCCTLRVTATAPEILMIARYILAAESTLSRQGINLKKRIARSNGVTRGLSESQRVELKRPCPFLTNGCCVIYQVRPLACRGHGSYDKQACHDAAAGLIQQIPYSIPYLTVRSLIQNAMQAALRDAGIAWASYELILATHIALATKNCEQAWLSGEDVFSAARTTEIDPAEMAKTYEAIKFS